MEFKLVLSETPGAQYIALHVILCISSRAFSEGEIAEEREREGRRARGYEGSMLLEAKQLNRSIVISASRRESKET